MAASSSDDSSKAPENFHVSSSNDENCDSQVNSNYCLKCPLCASLRKRFICRNCIQTGDIAHSSHHSLGRLSEKQQTYLKLQSNLKKCNARYEGLIAKWKITENLKFEVKKKQEKIALLKHLISGKKEHIASRLEYRNALKKDNQRDRYKLPAYENKVKKLKEYVDDRTEDNEKKKKENAQLLEQLKKTACRDIRKLVTFIFPISEVVLRDEVHVRPVTSGGVEDNLETIAALAEAKNTSYIRGKWVFHGSGISEMQYRIVAPSLPANGDYAAYLDWLAENKDDVPKSTANEIIPSRVAAFRIVGALTYTTQLTNLLSFFLNVRLPYKLAYGDFSKKLNEQQFMRKVSRLNTNIMYLAYTQHVKLSLLNENHTLENILAILNFDSGELGRYGPNEVAFAPLMKSIDSLLIGIETGTESESEDENSLRLDWEAVPNLASAQEIIQPMTMPPNPQTTSIAGGLMTSAANSIASIFRGWK